MGASLVRLKPHAHGRTTSGQSAGVGAKAGADEVLRWCRGVVARTGELENAAERCSTDELRGRTSAFRDRLRAGEPVSALLPEAFATVREAARRSIGLRHHDVQLIGGAVLHLGKVAEMRTGEGKTLTVTLPAYLAALTGQSVHVLTANDYLANRDFIWMRPVYELLDLSVDLLRTGPKPNPAQRQSAYAADIVYGASFEFCYDFLRDNHAWEKSDRSQRGLDLALVDEADLVLLDEMRLTPQLSIPAPEPRIAYRDVAAIAARLRPGVDYEVAQQRLIRLTDQGIDRVEDWLGATNLYSEENAGLVQQLEHALAARELYKRDQDYAVVGDAVIVIDSNSGRPQPGRRFADGLHEAIGAKEGLPVRAAMQVLATVTVRDYLRQYSMLAGLTGTAVTDAQTYQQIYGLDVVPVPTNRPMIRVDHPDLVYGTRRDKLAALAGDAARRHTAGQPVLIGAMSIDDADEISRLLGDLGVTHDVLTARNHDAEAEVLATAGRPGGVTVAVKMAGRGVDIVLGGADGAEYETVVDVGGLCVLGAERSTVGRMDLHLRGRAGRQGDPGESRFYASYDDELMKGVPKVGLSLYKDGIESRSVSNAIDRMQAKAAASQTAWLVQNVAYDDVLAEQQRLVYADRRTVLEQPNLQAKFVRMLDDVVRSGEMPPSARGAYHSREAELGAPLLRELERRVLLSATDTAWRDHLAAMADLITGLSIRAAGRLVSLPEYQREAAHLFDAMTAAIRLRAVTAMLTLKADVQ
jgi:preprotein translocase subunit SecA